MGLFGGDNVSGMIITLVDEKDRAISEYKVDLSHFDIEPEVIEGFIESLFKGNWLE
jgi:hypothetical protein